MADAIAKLSRSPLGPGFRLLSIIPLNFISWVVGAILSIKLPLAIRQTVLRGFAQLFGIAIEEAEHPLNDYCSIQDFFTRRLKAGARPIEKASVVSPADGRLAECGYLAAGRAVQAKGLTYDVGELVFGPGAHQSWFGAHEPRGFFTVYLAPHNYHRVHSAVTGTVIECRYIPGQLWPVNRLCVPKMPGLFVRNERLVFTIDTAGGGRVWLVMVGALNVGKIQTPLLPGFYSNHGPRQGDPLCHQVWSFAEGFRLESGDEIGTFMLGSTVVVVMDKLSLPRNGFDHLSSNQPLRVGQSLESSSDANGT